MSWNPELYLRFDAERTRPAVDLVGRIDVVAPRRVVDLGCGPGNSTAVVRSRWPDAEIVAVDSDAEMIEVATQSDATVEWVQANVAEWRPGGKFDVVFSNAMLQWLPDHASAVPRLFQALAAGGALAFQTPVRHNSPLHRSLQEVAGDARWRDVVADAAKALVSHDPEFYYDLLSPMASRVDLWTTEYCHVLDGPEAILAWIRSTRLRPFLSALVDDAERSRFEALLLQRLEAAYPRRVDGRVLFRFRRLFCVAYRASGLRSVGE